MPMFDENVVLSRNTRSAAIFQQATRGASIFWESADHFAASLRCLRFLRDYLGADVEVMETANMRLFALVFKQCPIDAYIPSSMEQIPRKSVLK